MKNFLARRLDPRRHAPVSRSGATALAVALLVSSPARAQEGRAQEAAAEAPLTDVEFAARLADGELLLRRGQPTEALDALRLPAGRDWPARRVALVLLGEAQLASGHHAAALASADAAEPLRGAHGPELAWLRARSLAALKRPEAAEAMLSLASDRSGLDEQRRGQALVRAAELFESSGRNAEAASAWRRAAFDAPTAAPADALERAFQLAASAGKPLSPLTTAQRLELARSLRRANLHARAVTQYRRAEAGLAGSALISAKLSRARSHFDLRENDEARAACADILKLAPGTDAAAECRLISARAAWRVNEGAAVMAHVDAALKDARLASAEARPDIRLLQGNYHLEQGRHEEAVRAFSTLLAETPGSSKAGEARWRIAWCRMHQGRFTDAAAEFTKLAREQPAGELERIGLLWSAIARERAGEDATAALADGARRFPWTHQGEQARRMLAARLDPAALAASEAEWSASGVTIPLPSAPDLSGEAGLRYRLLRDAGVHAWALAEIESLQSSRGKSDAFAFELARARARAGKASEAQALLRARFGEPLSKPSRGMPREFWEVAYPLPLEHLVRESSSRHGIDPVLCAAIIRCESGWDPAARSWADARGLMQLIPATARKLAKQEGLAGFHPDQLFDPAVNVALGARHLAALVAMFDGDLDAAIASYNAGEDKVAAWWAEFERDGVPPADRVERIPYRETRQYVRRVRDAMSWYAWLLSSDEDPA